MIAPFLVSIDWLSVYGYSGGLAQISDSLEIDGVWWHYKKRDYGSALWQSIYDVKRDKTPVAVICCNPRSNAIDARSTLLKLDNRVLYAQDCFKVLDSLLEIYKIAYKSISRCDLCYDCNVCKDGFSVPTLIQGVLSMAAGQIGHIVRKGSSRFAANGKRGQFECAQYNAIRFGTKQSKIGCYIYNKSLEMLEKGIKPWIVQSWENAGIKNETRIEEWLALKPAERHRNINSGASFGFVHTPVWRFEISIGSEGLNFASESTGNTCKLEISHLRNACSLPKIFSLYAQKVFDFKINTGQQHPRYYKPLPLFETAAIADYRPVRVSNELKRGRMFRHVIATLDRFIAQQVEEKGDLLIDFKAVRQHIAGYSSAMRFLVSKHAEADCMRDSELVPLQELYDATNEAYARYFECKDSIYNLLGKLEEQKKEILSHELDELLSDWPPQSGQ